MESSKEIILIASGLLIVIFAGTLALRLGISLRE
ncbi:photosystem I reaction center subunit XII [Prochlorococcus sp. AH-736-F09]|nr:photosystem I reaction center subunit XII [Prochlorococcus sp. AH-736-F09]